MKALQLTSLTKTYESGNSFIKVLDDYFIPVINVLKNIILPAKLDG